MDPSLWKDLAHQGPLVAGLLVALVYVFKANEKLHERFETLQKESNLAAVAADKESTERREAILKEWQTDRREWQAKYDAATDRHTHKAENWAEKGFSQGERLEKVLDQLTVKRSAR